MMSTMDYDFASLVVDLPAMNCQLPTISYRAISYHHQTTNYDLFVVFILSLPMKNTPCRIVRGIHARLVALLQLFGLYAPT